MNFFSRDLQKTWRGRRGKKLLLSERASYFSTSDVPVATERSVTSVDHSGLDRIPIITYHSIDDSGSIISTPPALFRRQIATLSASGYQTLTLDELTEMTRRGEWPSRKSVILTFDDGFENFYTEAAAVLKEHSFTATVFLVTGKCGGFNDWSGNPADFPRTRLLSWGQVMELSELGIEFGSHTVNHPDLTMLNSTTRQHELNNSKDTIEDAIGKKVGSFAYPFGNMTFAVKRAVEETYTSACSTNLGRISPRSDLHCLERLDAYYLSNPKFFTGLESRWLDGYFSVRQILRDVRSMVGRAGSN